MKDKKKAIVSIVILLVIVVGAVVAVSMNKKSSTTMGDTMGTSSSTKADTGGAVAATNVTISNYMFGPMAIKVKVGDTVTWTNDDSVHHNIAADKPSGDAPTGPLIGKGETYKYTFKKAGTYTYHCEPHPYMHGTVVVTE